MFIKFVPTVATYAVQWNLISEVNKPLWYAARTGKNLFYVKLSKITIDTVVANV
jgi:hypothetical protein